MLYGDDVQFEGDTPMINTSSIGIVSAENRMAEWLVAKGVAKSSSQAQLMLLGVAVGAAAVAGVMWWFFMPSDSGQQYKAPLEPYLNSVTPN